MAEDLGGEKTLPASPRKISQAREEGNVAKSADLNAALALLVAAFGLWYMGRELMERMVHTTAVYFENIGTFEVTVENAVDVAVDVTQRLGVLVLPLAILLTVAGLAVNFLQVGFLYAPKALQPKFSRLNPIAGFSRFFKLRTLVDLIKSLLKVAIVTWIVYLTLRSRMDDLLLYMFLTPLGITHQMADLIYLVWLRAAGAMLILGLLDFGFQKWQYNKDLMMTVQEMKEENKQMEGDPRIKQRIRQIQRQMAMQRMMKEVPKADVIITNPIRFAVAIRYDMGNMAAPVVVAKGARLLAKRIREIAMENQVPIIEKPELARALYKEIEVGHPIPEKLFKAVAEVLAFVYRIDRRQEKIRERQASMVRPTYATQ
ncbi:MAG: flagellar biosynthetic protein FlhB [Candidatus Hydrogenedentota bacterium]